MPCKNISIEKGAGEVLAEPIIDKRGRTLLKEGVTLAPLHIKLLKKIGIKKIPIIKEEIKEEPAKSSSLPIQEDPNNLLPDCKKGLTLENLEMLFKRRLDNEKMQILFGVVKNFIENTLSTRDKGQVR